MQMLLCLVVGGIIYGLLITHLKNPASLGEVDLDHVRMQCTHCQEVMHANWKFCPHCGQINEAG